MYATLSLGRQRLNLPESFEIDMLLHVVIEGFSKDNVCPLGPLVMAHSITDPSDFKSTWMGWNYIGVWN